MKTLRVEIDEEKDLSVLQEVLEKLGLKFRLEPSEFEQMSEAELFGLNEGLRDMDEGNVYSNEQARAQIDKKIAEMRLKYAVQ